MKFSNENVQAIKYSSYNISCPFSVQNSSSWKIKFHQVPFISFFSQLKMSVPKPSASAKRRARRARAAAGAAATSSAPKIEEWEDKKQKYFDSLVEQSNAFCAARQKGRMDLAAHHSYLGELDAMM
jgi:hypothetical protein